MSQLSGDAAYRAFLPAPLPPSPPLELTPDLVRRLSEADQAVARLDGATNELPNPDLFVAQFARKEALFSSQIEGTQASLIDVFEHEAGLSALRAGDVGEVVSYIAAMNHGLKRLETLPLSLRLIREIHAELLQGTRGAEKRPGEFRTSQNWIGSPGSTLAQATFVPPPPADMLDALGRLELYLHETGGYPSLIEAALVHAQFETIHPFLDGNGRTGRLLITFQLCTAGVLRRPILYMSYHLKRHRDAYYDHLARVRTEGAWEEWVAFFLTGVKEVSEHALRTAEAITALQQRDKQRLDQAGFGPVGLVLVDRLLQLPYVVVHDVAAAVSRTYKTANMLVDRLVALGLLTQVTSGRRNRVFAYREYVDLLREGTEPLPR